MRHQRVRNILAAGALTGLVLLTLIAFSWQNISARDAGQAQQSTVNSSTDSGSLQSENDQLRQAVQTLQQREADYQSQIESANQTILQLQSNGNSRTSFEDDDRYEGEHEEHEAREHEGYEREYYDD